jgi:ribose transport system ATP-binding protein
MNSNSRSSGMLDSPVTGGALPVSQTGSDTPALELTRASKKFGDVQVLSDVNLRVAPGEIRALVGANGSGKSTLVKILAGYHRPEPGATIRVGGRLISTRHADLAEEAGLRFVHQNLALVGGMSAVENLGLGTGFGSRGGRPVRWRHRRRDAEAAMARLGYHIDVEESVDRLQPSERTAVAVARAVSPHRSEAAVLVLDEPTATLPGAEVERLFTLIRRVRDSGIAILFISHHLNEVFDLADSVTVLREGREIGTQAVTDVDEPTLIEMMVGRAVVRSATKTERKTSRVVMSATGLTGRSVQGIDLEVRAGEIVGVAGITGSGREAVAPVLFGADNRSGTVVVDGKTVRAKRPDLSMAAGMGFLPADRDQNAVLPGHDVSENISISRPQDFVRRGALRRRLESQAAAEWAERLDLRPRSPRTLISRLSGGNAQKTLLARWLRLEPKVMLLDEPTQGVDVGAKEEIHQRVEGAAEQGCAVLVCSTDSDELTRLCSRVIVLVDGRIHTELVAPLNSDEITAALLATPGEESR